MNKIYHLLFVDGEENVGCGIFESAEGNRAAL